MTVATVSTLALGGSSAAWAIPAQQQETGATIPAAADSDVGVQKKHTASLDCTSPKKNNANYSWENGSNSTTIYFNNHCGHKVNAKVRFVDPASGDPVLSKCLSTNGGTKGKKLYDLQLHATKITRGC